MIWDTIEITTATGEQVKAQAPVIISASRATDIPAFYADWFFDRLKIGYSVWTNPFNGIRSYISYAHTRIIVFWSKNPRPLLAHIDELRQRGINCYLHYTLNDYEAERLEPGIPPLDERIETFHNLVERLGKGKIIWRFDPFLLTDRIGIPELLHKVEKIGDRLSGYTEKLVFSFADIHTYRKVRNKLRSGRIHYREFDEPHMLELASGLAELNKRWGYTLATCGEKIDLTRFGIESGKCIDDDLMIKYFPDDTRLMDFLGVEMKQGDLFDPATTIVKQKNNKDKGQRRHCGCIVSKDIGEYDTCPHLCEYCYANRSKKTVLENYRAHRACPDSETLKPNPLRPTE